RQTQKGGCCVFFFSSRRRHTSFDCDWSSDVCSSDLTVPVDRALSLSNIQTASVTGWPTFPMIQVTALPGPAPLTGPLTMEAGPEIGRASCRESGRSRVWAGAGECTHGSGTRHPET